jgi:RHH-type transcriptional regulator, proline utilization regulon repressor / proline dehydrogenase / delta 1-pyrroline-5-carboxylate dehydrogenase
MVPMDSRELNARTVERGKELYAALEDEKPSLFQESRWVGRMMGWLLKHEELRADALRFIDVFPSLTTDAMLVDHLEEYFGSVDVLHTFLRWALRRASTGGLLARTAMAKTVRYTVRKLGEQFVLGENAHQAVRRLSGIRREGCAFSVDILGELVLSEGEAEKYRSLYMDLLAALASAKRKWSPLGTLEKGNDLDWGFHPKFSVSLKPTSLYSQAKPQNFTGSVEAMVACIRPVYEKVLISGGSLCIDMESYQFKDLSLAVYKRLRAEYAAHSHLALAMQAYLVDTDRDLGQLLDWSTTEGLPVTIRLVKGAYWDHEVMRALQNGWDVPVHMNKSETDAAFERQALLVLSHSSAYLACGTHNIRSIAAVMEGAKALGVPDNRYEFQVLYGMAEPIRRVLTRTSGRVRVYCPYGPILYGMAYLVRRLLENTANQSFLRLVFSETKDVLPLLADPAEATGDPRVIQRLLPREGEAPTALPAEGATRAPRIERKAVAASPFSNQPPADFTREEERKLFAEALSAVRKEMGGVCPLFINGVDKITDDVLQSLNPADPGDVIAHVSQAGLVEVDEAIAAAQAAFVGWHEKESTVRAGYLTKAAAWMRSHRHELAAWQVWEIGKQWDQASADVAEAIDFLEYYASQMVRLGGLHPLPSPPGELNQYHYEARGVTAVIAPWNFPLAITTGMVSAAVVTGNCVVYKPSPLTPAIGRNLVEAFRAAGLPAGVFNFIPGRTEVIAEHLINHPLITTIAFTGSTQTGLRIIESAAVLHPGQSAVKRVIAEMGGKNAIIIDDDADLDEAVPAVLVSAFGFQGQKCSSCSRVIVLESIYDAFIDRLVDAAQSLVIGPAHDPAFVLGPVCDGQARAKISGYIDVAATEGKILYSGKTPPGSNYVPITIVGDITPEHRLAREEVFGPVLSVMKVKTFDQALEWANSTRFALTGGVFSRSPRHLDEARKKFQVGNLYLNRHITGAIVGRQPFGGFKMSGLGTRAGGEEYLLHFMDPRVITENTARRGFSPDLLQ